jgi:hypothetical protein
LTGCCAPTRLRPARAPALTDVIRNHEYILVVAVNTDADGYNNLLCHVGISDHWHFNDHTIAQMNVTVTPDAVVTQVCVRMGQGCWRVRGPSLPLHAPARSFASLSQMPARVARGLPNSCCTEVQQCPLNLRLCFAFFKRMPRVPLRRCWCVLCQANVAAIQEVRAACSSCARPASCFSPVFPNLRECVARRRGCSFLCTGKHRQAQAAYCAVGVHVGLPTYVSRCATRVAGAVAVRACMPALFCRGRPRQVVGGSLLPPYTVEAALVDGTIVLSNIVLPAENPVRFFLLPYSQAQ